MNAILLARMQFGISIGFHYIFPQTTLGLTLIILIAESLYVAKTDETWKNVSVLLTKFLGVVFAFGVGTGMVLPLSFGMNWGNFSVFAAPVFGTQLAIEAMVAFTLEAAFMAILVFGRSRVSRQLYLASAGFVFLGAHLSAFFIVSANSWLETPAGYAIEGGQIVLTNWLQATFNPSFIIRFLHTITAAWLSGMFFILAVCAVLIMQNRRRETATRVFRLVAALALVFSVLQPLLGHQQIMNVHWNQPIKDASYEGIFESQNGAPLIVFGIPDAAHHRIIFPLGIPKALSFLETLNPNSPVQGLDDFPVNLWPPVNAIFTTFHVMVALAAVIVATALAALFAARSKAGRALEDRKTLLHLIICGAAAPYMANELGWIGAEIGRQPWTVYGLLMTKDAGTVQQAAGTVLFSLILFCVVYAALAALFFRFIQSTIKSIPMAVSTEDGHANV